MTEYHVISPWALEPTAEEQAAADAARLALRLKEAQEEQRLRERAAADRAFWIQHEKDTTAAIAAQDAQQARIREVLSTRNRDAVLVELIDRITALEARLQASGS
jgi:hypothetical protein